MPLLVNIHQLEKQPLNLRGELTVAELGWETRDEMIHVSRPLYYQLHVQRLEKSILAQGSLRQELDCVCVRCLKPFAQEVQLEHWSCLLELAGEDKTAVINDCVDLTPVLREDIFLAFPQHPVCGPQCDGLAMPQKDLKTGSSWESSSASAAWAELNKLKWE